MTHRIPEETAHRVDLKAWAEAELAKLEECTPGGGVIKIGTAPLAKTTDAAVLVALFDVLGMPVASAVFLSLCI